MSNPPGGRKSQTRLKCTLIITVKSAVVVFTRRVFHVVHVVRPDVFGAGQHVRFAQQRPEVTDVGVGHAAVLAPDVVHVVYDLYVRCRCHRRRPLPSALKDPMQKHPSDMGHGFRRVHNEDDLCRCDNRRYRYLYFKCWRWCVTAADDIGDGVQTSVGTRRIIDE